MSPAWLVDGLIPAGAIVAVADLDDPPPSALIAGGADVVMLLHDRGAIGGEPVQLSVHWRPGLVPGHQPPPPLWIRFTGAGFVRVPNPNPDPDPDPNPRRYP